MSDRAPEERKLAEIIVRIIDLRYLAASISPAWVATEAMIELDPTRIAPPLVYAGCHLQLRQIARQQLRGKYEPKDGDGDQHELFPGLQRRYPTAHSAKKEEPEYRLLEDLSDIDIGYNIARLRAEAEAKQKHADSLDAYRRSRRKTA